MKELIKERDTVYAKATEEIFASMPNILDGIAQFVNDSGPFPIEKDQIEWDDIKVISIDVGEDKQQKEFVIIIATANIPSQTGIDPSDSIDVEDDDAVTKHTIQVSIPIDVVEENDKMRTYSWLKKVVADQERRRDLTMRSLISQLEDEANAQHVQDGFDLDSLTEEQQEAFKLALHKIEGGMH